MIRIAPGPLDAPEYLEVVDQVIAKFVEPAAPSAIRVVGIDEWFDSKWLGFSGKLLGALGVANHELTVPPFHPRRVLSEATYRRAADGRYILAHDAPPLHVRIPSERNTFRRLTDVAPDTTCLWYTGNSARSKRAALMVYATGPEGYWAWYAALEHATSSWRVTRRRGITPAEWQRLFDQSDEQQAV